MSEEDVLREIVEILARRKSRSEMIREFLREASLLSLVFVPFDVLFNPDAVSPFVIATVIALGVLIGFLGIRLEESSR
jgi:hypothetical protein